MERFLAGAIAVVAGGIATVLSAWLSRVVYAHLNRTRMLRQGVAPETTAERVRRLTQALKESADTVDEIEQEIRERHQLAENLERDIERYEHLRNMKQEEIEAVVQALDTPIQRAGRRSLLYNFLFFLAGVVATTLISWLLA